MIRELGLGPTIVVGHSLGGLTALLLNDLHPELVLGVACCDAPLRPDIAAAAGRTAAALREAGTTAPLQRLLDSFWTEDSPAELRETVEATMLGRPVDVVAGMLDALEPFSERFPEILKAADAKPFMALWPARPQGQPAWLRDVCVFLRQEPIPGAGHFLQLERPAVTNALLRAFLDDVERDPRIKRE
jgi:pimeloyl-ACP methyl ester carboxylesterase